MYEIWLMLNIVVEVALSVWPWLAALAVLWLGLMWLARGRDWRASLPAAIGLGLAVSAVVFFFMPGWIRSSLGEMKYWVDWANLLGIAAAWGVAGTLLAWPRLTALRKRRRKA